jgi:hypothetical protein
MGPPHWRGGYTQLGEWIATPSSRQKTRQKMPTGSTRQLAANEMPPRISGACFKRPLGSTSPVRLASMSPRRQRLNSRRQSPPQKYSTLEMCLPYIRLCPYVSVMTSTRGCTFSLHRHLLSRNYRAIFQVKQRTLRLFLLLSSDESSSSPLPHGSGFERRHFMRRERLRLPSWARSRSYRTGTSDKPGRATFP